MLDEACNSIGHVSVGAPLRSSPRSATRAEHSTHKRTTSQKDLSTIFTLFAKAKKKERSEIQLKDQSKLMKPDSLGGF